MKAYLSQCERDERRELMSAGIVDIQRQLIKKRSWEIRKPFRSCMLRFIKICIGLRFI